MKRLQVCLSPALIPLYELEGKTVIVTDVLRATSTMVSALDIGVKEILPVATRQEAMKYIGKANHLVAGERDGKKVEGFDLGNSPLLLKEHREVLQGNTLVMTTTNGTKAIKLSEAAANVYIGALTNVKALADHLISEEENIEEVLVVCAGWKNRINLEDTLFAGAIAQELQAHFEIYGDAAIMSHQLFELHQNNLFTCIQQATHYKRLKSHGIENDIKHCMTLNSSKTIPILKKGKIIAV